MRDLAGADFLRGVSLTGAIVRVGLPPLAAMFNSNGTAYAADASRGAANRDPLPALVQRQRHSGALLDSRRDRPRLRADAVPCAARAGARTMSMSSAASTTSPPGSTGQGNGHFNALCGLMTGTAFTGRGAGGPSIDQSSPPKIGAKSRFRSLQIGVAQESHGENIHRNMSWAGLRARAAAGDDSAQSLRPPVRREESKLGRTGRRACSTWFASDVDDLTPALGQADRQRLDEHLTSVRDLERAISSLPPDYGKNLKEPEDITDLTDYPRIAKIQSDLLVHAFASGQTRVAVYMLTKCQSLTRFPWLGPRRQPASRLHAQQRRLARAAAHHARHLPLARRGVRLPAGADEVDTRKATAICSTTPAACSSTSTPKPIRTSATAWRSCWRAAPAR